MSSRLTADAGAPPARPRRPPGPHALVTLWLVMLLAAAGAGTGTAHAYPADEATADRSLLVSRDREVGFSGFGPDAHTSIWKAGGEYAYCMLPSETFGADKTRPARVLRPGDFPSERLYRAAIAAFYYGPGGPGYETLGKRLFMDAGWDGSALTDDDRYVMVHMLIGCYYTGSWENATTRITGQRMDVEDGFARWFRENAIPAGSAWSSGDTLGSAFNRHANDADMVANGGFTFEGFAGHVLVVMGGTTSSGTHRQDFITWDGPPTGTISLAKHSAAPALTQGNARYSLKGAEYGIYGTEALARGRDRSDALLTGTTGQVNADGSQADDYFRTGPLATGTYYVAEIGAPEGYAPDGSVHAVTVRAGADTRVDAARGYVEDAPLGAPLGILLEKVDADTGAGTPQGSASLEGAEFSVSYYDGYHDAESLPEAATRSWTVRTDAAGRASLSDACKVSGPDFYRLPGGEAAMPLGTVAIVETKPPEGYLLGTDGAAPETYVMQIVADDGARGGAAARPLNYGAGAEGDAIPRIPDQVKHVGFRAFKADSVLGGAGAEGDASLEGAVFSVVNDGANPVVVGGMSFMPGEECATATSSMADGACVAQLDGSSLPYGSYRITEKTAPRGYRLNGEWEARVTVDAGTEDGKVFDLSSDPCGDVPERGGIRVPKVDRERKAAEPLGAATLAGAELAITLASDQPVVVDGSVFRTGDVVKTIVTREDGTAATGSDDLPYGTYRVTEARAPGGYVADPAWSATVEVREDGALHAAETLEDQVKRGDVRFNKVDGSSMARMGGVAFLVTSKTTGESHVVVADGNGCVDTSAGWAAHTEGTNENDAALRARGGTAGGGGGSGSGRLPAAAPGDGPDDGTGNGQGGEAGGWKDGEAGDEPDGGTGGVPGDDPDDGTGAPRDGDADDGDAAGPGAAGESGGPYEVDPAALDPESGVWFSGRDGASSKPDDALGALPYDTYRFRELRSDANAGKQLVEFDVRVYRHGQVVDMGTVADGALAIGTELKGTSGSHVVPAAARVDLVDTVTCTGLDAGTVYTLKGQLVDKETGEAIGGGAAEARFKAVAGAGEAEVRFSIDASSLAGRRVVAYQELYEGDVLAAEHKDPDDPDQTVSFPAIETVLAAPDSGKSAHAGDGAVKLVDRIDYSGLDPAAEYTVTGTLHGKTADGGDAGTIGDAAGAAVSASTSFRPATPDGSVTVTFEFTPEAGDAFDAVAFEELSSGGTVYAAHADISDAAQTAHVAPGTPDEPERPPSAAEPEDGPEEKPEPEAEGPAQPETDRTGGPGKAFDQTGNPFLRFWWAAALPCAGIAACIAWLRRARGGDDPLDWPVR